MGTDEFSTPGVSERCATCGEHIQGENREDMIKNYTEHQIEHHHKPRTV